MRRHDRRADQLCRSSQGASFLSFLFLPFADCPLQSDAFQADLFPAALSDQASLTADSWFSGKNAEPVLIDLETQATTSSGVSSTPARSYAPSAATAAPTPTPTASAPAPEPAAVAVEAPKSVEAPKPVETPPSRAITPPPPAAVVETPRVEAAATNGASSNDKELEALKEENLKLKEAVSERDTLIRVLELRLEKVKVRSWFDGGRAELMRRSGGAVGVRVREGCRVGTGQRIIAGVLSIRVLVISPSSSRHRRREARRSSSMACDSAWLLRLVGSNAISLE